MVESVADFEIPKEVAAINDTLLGEFAAEQKPPAIDALLRVRRSLIELLTPRIQEAFDVGLRGIESGEIEAVIKAQQDSTRVGPAEEWSQSTQIQNLQYDGLEEEQTLVAYTIQ